MPFIPQALSYKSIIRRA